MKLRKGVCVSQKRFKTLSNYHTHDDVRNYYIEILVGLGLSLLATLDSL